MRPFMKIAKAAGVLAISMTALTTSYAGPAYAQSKARYCHHYADTAIRQHHRNHDWDCHFSEPRWHAGWQSHFGWCMAVPRRVSRRESQFRRRRLAHCHEHRY